MADAAVLSVAPPAGGRRVYSREFLLQFQPLCTACPPQLAEINKEILQTQADFEARQAANRNARQAQPAGAAPQSPVTAPVRAPADRKERFMPDFKQSDEAPPSEKGPSSGPRELHPFFPQSTAEPSPLDTHRRAFASELRQYRDSDRSSSGDRFRDGGRGRDGRDGGRGPSGSNEFGRDGDRRDQGFYRDGQRGDAQGRRGGSGPMSGGGRFDRNGRDGMNSRDFRDPFGSSSRGRFDRDGGRNNFGGRGYERDSRDRRDDYRGGGGGGDDGAVPEWFSDAPTSALDVIELGGLPDEEKQRAGAGGRPSGAKDKEKDWRTNEDWRSEFMRRDEPTASRAQDGAQRERLTSYNSEGDRNDNADIDDVIASVARTRVSEENGIDDYVTRNILGTSVEAATPKESSRFSHWFSNDGGDEGPAADEPAASFLPSSLLTDQDMGFDDGDSGYPRQQRQAQQTQAQHDGGAGLSAFDRLVASIASGPAGGAKPPGLPTQPLQAMDARMLEQQTRGPEATAQQSQPHVQPQLQPQPQQPVKPAVSTLPKSMTSFMPTSVIKHLSTQKKKEAQAQGQAQGGPQSAAQQPLQQRMPDDVSQSRGQPQPQSQQAQPPSQAQMGGMPPQGAVSMGTPSLQHVLHPQVPGDSAGARQVPYDMAYMQGPPQQPVQQHPHHAPHPSQMHMHVYDPSAQPPPGRAPYGMPPQSQRPMGDAPGGQWPQGNAGAAGYHPGMVPMGYAMHGPPAQYGGPAYDARAQGGPMDGQRSMDPNLMRWFSGAMPASMPAMPAVPMQTGGRILSVEELERRRMGL